MNVPLEKSADDRNKRISFFMEEMRAHASEMDALLHANRYLANELAIARAGLEDMELLEKWAHLIDAGVTNGDGTIRVQFRGEDKESANMVLKRKNTRMAVAEKLKASGYRKDLNERD